MNEPTAMIRDFFILTEYTWTDLSQVLLKVKDRERVSKILYKYLSIHEYAYSDFVIKQYPDGTTLSYRKALKTSRRVFGDVDWNAIACNLRAVKQIEEQLITT